MEFSGRGPCNEKSCRNPLAKELETRTLTRTPKMGGNHYEDMQLHVADGMELKVGEFASNCVKFYASETIKVTRLKSNLNK